MNNLAKQKCRNHHAREAVARCPDCQRFYCRECIAEHDGRIVCASCLTKDMEKTRVKPAGYFSVFHLLQCFAGLLLLLFFFFALGQALLKIPSEFHEGQLWKEDFWGEDSFY